MSNKKTYESEAIVRLYAMADCLQKPEQTILAILKDKLKNMTMLDLGVGGGRTTIHFAKLAREYVGVDYAKKMIEACEKRFPKEERISFKVADARLLKDFAEHYFDFVLCGFNGLDYMNHQDRIKSLKEIRRVLKQEGGIFVFSSHNLNCLDKLYAIKYFNNPIKLAWRILRYFILLLLNGSPKKLKTMNWAIINDGAHGFGLKTHYIAPLFQIQQLQELGFKNIRLFSRESGEEIISANLREIDDGYIYYLCNL